MAKNAKKDPGKMPEAQRRKWTHEELVEAHQNPDPKFLERDRQADKNDAWLWGAALRPLLEDDAPPTKK